MKRLKQTIVILAVVLAPLAPFVLVPVASASTCENGYTGPDSNNLCTNTTTYTCTVSNDNKIAIVNDNTQVSLSGDAESEENTEAGGAQTGTATNTNGVTFNVVVTNPTVGDELCVVTATVPATPTPTPPAPVVPAGQGAVAVTAPKAVVPQSLAKTSGDSMAGYVIGSTVVLAAAFGLSRAAVFAYGRYKA